MRRKGKSMRMMGEWLRMSCDGDLIYQMVKVEELPEIVQRN